VSALRVGIAGCGLIGGGPVRGGRPIAGTHAQACREVEGVELWAAADPDATRRAAFGAHWGVERLYADHRAMLDGGVDLIVAATPPAQHEAVCTDAVRAGVRGVLCEKPFTGDARAARRVCEAARAASVPLVVNFSRRWDTNHQALARRFAAGEWGALSTAWGVYTGELRGNGAHLVDTLRMLAPGAWQVEWSSAAGAADGPIAAVLRSGGARAYLGPATGTGYFIFELTLLAAAGRARLQSGGNDIQLDRPSEDARFPGYRYLQPVEQLPRDTLPGTFARALGELARAAREGTPPSVAPEETVGTLDLIDAITQWQWRAHANEATP
jgi:predicted dehydrogenase